MSISEFQERYGIHAAGLRLLVGTLITGSPDFRGKEGLVASISEALNDLRYALMSEGAFGPTVEQACVLEQWQDGLITTAECYNSLAVLCENNDYHSATRAQMGLTDRELTSRLLAEVAYQAELLGNVNLREFFRAKAKVDRP